uniref:Transmembrane protein 106A n=1 Tax=Buteo japonicus TaxID=224669 RepID=A0A8B9Z8X4_9AVES
MTSQELGSSSGEGKLILPRQLDAEGEIANYASINDSATSCAPCVGIARRSCVNCPTCQGTGRIPRGRMIVALVLFCRKLYVCVAVTICLLTTSLSIFFLFPRSVTVLPAGLNASSVGFNATTASICLNMTNMLNITNNNFYLVTVVQLDIEVLHQSLVVGKTTMKTLLNMSPLQSSQIYYTVASRIMDDNTYSGLLLPCRGTLTCTYLCHSEQLAFEDYQYVDCRGNATLPHPLYHRVP